MQDTAGEVRTNSAPTFSYGLFHTEEQVLDDQLDLIYNSCVQTQEVVKKTYRKRWTMEMNDKRELWKSVLKARHDDGDDEIDR